MPTSIQQAACDALAAWLQLQLDGDGEDPVIVEPRWFEPSRDLPPLAVTVIPAGERSVIWDDPVLLRQDDGTTAAKVSGLWAVGWVEQPLQLDVWATHDVGLDSLRARLEGPLNRGAAPLGGRVDPFGAGLVVPLADEWDTFTASIYFDQSAIAQTPDSVNTAEWRATARGKASMRLALRAESPRMARVLLKSRLDSADTETTIIT